MNFKEARAVVAAGRHLPTHFDWLVQQAQLVVRRMEIDYEVMLRGDLPTLSPQEYERINLALAMRLAIACNRVPFAVPVPVIRVKSANEVAKLPKAEKVAMLGVGA